MHRPALEVCVDVSDQFARAPYGELSRYLSALQPQSVQNKEYIIPYNILALFRILCVALYLYSIH